VRADLRVEPGWSGEPSLLLLVAAGLVAVATLLEAPILRLLAALAGLLTLAEWLSMLWSGSWGITIAGFLLGLYSWSLLEAPLSLIGAILGGGLVALGLIGRLFVVSRRTYLRRARSQLELLDRLLEREGEPS
jgi:hypothetical protein